MAIRSYCTRQCEHVCIFTLHDNLTLNFSPPVGEDFEYTTIGDRGAGSDTKTYNGNVIFSVVTDMVVVKIEKNLDTNDVVYTKIECPVENFLGEPISYTYSMGSSFVMRCG
jgi:hypothetical protein